MELLLKNCPDTINELNLLKQTPLHLAVGHSSCVALLLRGPGRKLIDVPDSKGRRPIEYALFSCLCGTNSGRNQQHDGCLNSHGDTSLEILLDADCMIPNVASWQFNFNASERALCDNCLRVISAHLVDRSEGLKKLAANNLPRMQATAFGLFSSCLLDSNAPRVIQALNERGISVPPSLQVHGFGRSSSVYHNCGSMPFSVLWSLGFRELDTPNSNGVTPLILECRRDMSWFLRKGAARCSWLIEHGADLWKATPDGASTIGHELYSTIGHLPPHWEDSDKDLRKHVFDLTRKLSHRDLRDRCRCACSPGGCIPFVRFLKAAFRQRDINSPSEVIKQLPEIMMETHTSVTKVQMRFAVRYATFEMLGIRHTCCHVEIGGFIKRDRQNVEFDELRQEDRFLVAHLEHLTPEFEVELEKMGRERHVNKRVSFWRGHWLPRMQQVLESIENTEMEEPDKVAAEDVGVVWHKQESGKGKDLDRDSESGSEDGGYRESDWDSEIDEEDMFDTFRSIKDWDSRLDLIMAKAGLSSGL